MREYWADFTLSFEAHNEDERDEILDRLKAALENTEYKTKNVQCTHCEEA